ncbi:MAG: glycosyltransferase [Ignavibacteria bacterium]|jgi:processive 1,2-diacylglycerol beta-glucosyltransferase/1,2-diacylglycerol 3-beta-galactosyltransferase
MKKTKYLLIYLNTGGGHLAPARAISDYMKKYKSDVAEAVMVDGLENSPKWVKYIIEDGYRILQAKAQWVFEFLYSLNKAPLLGKITSRIVSLFITPHIKKVIQDEKPDIIINLHFFTIKPVIKVIKKYNTEIPFYTMVTDPYTAHPIWFHHANQKYIVFSEKLSDQIKQQYPETDVYMFPFVVNEKFSQRLDVQEVESLKNELELPDDKKIILIVGGGDGIPKGEKILKRLLKKNLNASIIMLCGRNKQLFENANKIKSSNPDSCIKVYGFVNNVYELLNIADVVITKCGASTIMEILSLGKVPFVNNYIWEQEKGNVEYLKRNNVGIYEPKVKKMVKKIQKLLANDYIKKYYELNHAKSNIKNGLPDVVNFLVYESKFIMGGVVPAENDRPDEIHITAQISSAKI